MSKQEARKHHYIPRFILKNFNDENGQVNYWDVKKKKLEKRNIKSIFMNVDMYRDETLNSEDPTQIESRFSIFEREIADLIAKKVLDKDEVILSRRELEMLRIFITLLSFRSDSRKNQYINNDFNTSTRNELLRYQPDGNFEKLWKRELDVISICRTFEDIENSSEIDPILKSEFSNALKGFYMTFIDARGGEFILSDIYPTLEIFPMLIANIHMHFMLPISPTRMILLNHIMFLKKSPGDLIFAKMVELSKIKGDAISPPRERHLPNGSMSLDDIFVYKVKKIYASDVKYMNALVLNEARVGIIFHDKDKIIDSIQAFNRRNDTKQDYNSFENILIEKSNLV